MSYEWDKNCAVVDRLSYWQYFIRGTTCLATILTMKDLLFIKKNWYADRAKRRIPIVIINLNLVLGCLVGYQCCFWMVFSISFNLSRN